MVPLLLLAPSFLLDHSLLLDLLDLRLELPLLFSSSCSFSSSSFTLRLHLPRVALAA